MTEQDRIWRTRFFMFTLLRLTGVAMFLGGIAIAYSDLLRPGGWPLLGGLLVICGVIDALFAPRMLKRLWERQDAGR